MKFSEYKETLSQEELLKFETWLAEYEAKTNSKFCECAANEGDAIHVESDHKYDCGGWTYDPPCGGCYQCIAAQVLYYRYLDEKENK
jgi:hypothetical protein